MVSQHAESSTTVPFLGRSHLLSPVDVQTSDPSMWHRCILTGCTRGRELLDAVELKCSWFVTIGYANDSLLINVLADALVVCVRVFMCV